MKKYQLTESTILRQESNKTYYRPFTDSKYPRYWPNTPIMFTRGNFLFSLYFVSQVLDEHAYLKGQSAFWLGSFNFCCQISVPGVTRFHPKLSFHQWRHLYSYFKGIIEQPYPENIACVIHTSSLPWQSKLISLYVGLTPGKWKQ